MTVIVSQRASWPGHTCSSGFVRTRAGSQTIDVAKVDATPQAMTATVTDVQATDASRLCRFEKIRSIKRVIDSFDSVSAMRKRIWLALYACSAVSVRISNLIKCDLLYSLRLDPFR